MEDVCTILLLTAKKSGVSDKTLGKILRIIAIIANVSRHQEDTGKTFPSSIHRLKTLLKIDPQQDQKIVFICPAMSHKKLQRDEEEKVSERCGYRVSATKDPSIFRCDLCEKLWTKRELDKDGNFFATVPLHTIMTKTMERLGRFVSTDEFSEKEDGVMNDVVDGSRYSRMGVSRKDLIIIAHSDGAAISKSTSKKLYLTYVQCVNIPLHIRLPVWCLQQVWVAEHLPKDRECFLVEFSKQLKRVQTGNHQFMPVEWTDCSGSAIQSSAYVHSYLSDTPERATISGQLSHSAAQGCLYCLQKAQSINNRMCYR